MVRRSSASSGRSHESQHAILVTHFDSTDENLAIAFGKIAAKAIGAALEHDQLALTKRKETVFDVQLRKESALAQNVGEIFDFFDRRLTF